MRTHEAITFHYNSEIKTIILHKLKSIYCL